MISKEFVYAIETDRAHLLRLHTQLQSNTQSSSTLSVILPPYGPRNKIRDYDGSGIIFMNRNPLALNSNFEENTSLPLESYKYITRTFYVPYTLRDLDFLPFHPSIKKLIQEEEVKIKVQTHPKYGLSDPIISLLQENAASRCSFVPSSSNYTHLLQIIYDPADCIFHWGISTIKFAEEQLLTSEKLYAKTVENRLFKPVCRAFYKLDEVFNKHWKDWQWEILHHAGNGNGNGNGIGNGSSSVAVDIGASPGGWTQALHGAGYSILAVDAGDMHPSVLQLENVQYVRGLIESDVVVAKLKENSGKIGMIVCDINVPPIKTCLILRDHVLPYANQTRCYVVFTFKMHKNPTNNVIAMFEREVVRILSATAIGGHDFHLIHLTANSKNERTFCCILSRPPNLV